MKRLIAVFGLALFLGTSASVSAAPMKPLAPSMKAPTPEEAMMAKVMKLGAPGAHHQVLNVLVGRWIYTGKMWMSPDAKPQDMNGMSQSKWIFGNRFIYEYAMGGKPNMPFEGLGILGYDNIRQEYVSIWLDNMGTGIMEGSSQYDAGTQTFAEKGSVSCPITGEGRRKYRAVWKIVDKNHYTYEMYMRGPGGKKFKALELSYQRAK